MALTIQSISDVERLLQQVSQPYQAMSTKNARVDRYRDFLISLLSNAMGRELTEAELEIADIGFSFLNENEFLPGLHSGGAQYNDVLSSLLSVNGPRGGSSYKDQQALQQLANLAYNTNTQINNNVYNNDGTMNFQLTRGLDSKLATQLSTQILHREIKGKKLSDISDTLSFGKSSSEMRDNLERYVKDRKIEADGELHARIQTQIHEIEALEDEALIRFAYRTNAEDKIIRTDAEGNIVKDDKGEIVYDTIKHKLDPGFKLEHKGKQIQSEAEFARLSDTNQRAAAREYRKKLIDQAIKAGDDALIKDESGRVIDYYLYDDKGNRLQTSKAAVDEAGNIRRDDKGNVIQESTDLRLSDVMQSFLQSDDAKDAIKFKTKIRGRTVSQTSANILNEMLTYGDTTETVLKNQVSEKVFQGMADAAENVRFISKAFDLQDMTQVEAVAEASGLGDILDTSNASKTRQQLEELKRMAIAQNRDIKDLFKERADLVELLGVEYGGTQYVSKDFTTNLHRIMTQYNTSEIKGPAGVPMKTPEEIAQEVIRSRANAENVFGGFAIGQYAVNHMDHLSEETRDQIHNMVQLGRKYLKDGDRERAHLISEDIRALVNEAVGGELSHAHNRQAQALYGNTDYELSVGSGLKVQLRDVYDRQFDAGVLGYSARQEEMQELWEKISRIQSSPYYEQLLAIENDESLSVEQKEQRKLQVLKESKEFKNTAIINKHTENQRTEQTDKFQKYLEGLQLINESWSTVEKEIQDAADKSADEQIIKEFGDEGKSTLEKLNNEKNVLAGIANKEDRDAYIRDNYGDTAVEIYNKRQQYVASERNKYTKEDRNRRALQIQEEKLGELYGKTGREALSDWRAYKASKHLSTIDEKDTVDIVVEQDGQNVVRTVNKKELLKAFSFRGSNLEQRYRFIKDTEGNEIDASTIDASQVYDLTEVSSGIFNIRNIQEDEKRVKEFREQEQKLLGDIVDITGSNESDIHTFTGAYNKYKDILDNKVEYQGKTGKEAAQEWLSNEYANTLRSQGYSEDLVNKNIDVMTRLYEAGTDGNKLRSYLVTQMSNTGTIVQGSTGKAQAWLEKFHEISNAGDKSLDMSMTDQIMAGLFGDGSGFLDEKEAINIQYKRWLDSKATKDSDGNIIAKEDSIESLQEFFREKGELGGASLGGYALETFIEGGAFGSKEDIDKFVKDIAKEDSSAVLGEDGKFKGGKYKGLTAREAYNQKVAETILNDKESQDMLKEIGVDVNNEESKKKFIDTIKNGGAQGLFREYLQPNGYDIMTAGKNAFLARRISSQQFSAELNEEFSNISKADLSKYLKGDSQIDSNEFMQLMTQMYGIEHTDMEELLTKSGMLDDQGRFGSKEEAGILAGKSLEEARLWFRGPKVTDKKTIDKEFGEGAYDKFIKGDTSGIKDFDSKTGKYMKKGSKYYGKTADQILTENISEEHKKAYIDSQYGEGAYEALISDDPKHDKRRKELIDKDGKFKEGEFKGRTMDTVLAQFARGDGTTDQQFMDLILSQTGKDIDLKATSAALQEAGILNSEGKFKEGIFKDKTLEEANEELNKKGADGVTLAERINNYRQSLEQTTSAEIAGTVKDLLTSTTSIESCLTDIKGLISDKKDAPRNQQDAGQVKKVDPSDEEA